MEVLLQREEEQLYRERECYIEQRRVGISAQKAAAEQIHDTAFTIPN